MTSILIPVWAPSQGLPLKLCESIKDSLAKLKRSREFVIPPIDVPIRFWIYYKNISKINKIFICMIETVKYFKFLEITTDQSKLSWTKGYNSWKLIFHRFCTRHFIQALFIKMMILRIFSVYDSFPILFQMESWDILF